MAQEPENVEELTARIEEQWSALDAQISRYPDDVLTGPSDAAGWTIRDHLAHLTAWEASVLGFIRDGRPQNETMGVDRTLWETDDLDAVNERIRVQTSDTPLTEVMAALQATRRELVAALGTLTTERLRERWVNGSIDASDAPTILEKVTGNTVEHYPEHAEWIAAIAKSRSDVS